MYTDNLRRNLTMVVTQEHLAKLQEQVKVLSSQKVTVNDETKYLVNYISYNTVIGYDKIVQGLIKDKYSIEEEICLTNKGIVDSNNEEYVEYRNYVEQCKINARVFIEERYNAVGK